MKTILIFGGYGFVGNELYNHLIANKYKVFRYTTQKKNSKILALITHYIILKN